MRAKQSPKVPSQIPEFRSYEEEAEFWDTHSPWDFPGEFEEVNVTFAHPLEIVRVKNWHESLTNALAKLAEGERQVFSLNMLGLTDAQITRVTGYSPIECQKALRAARRKTRSLTTPDHK